jgi:hypothetical protein
MVEQDPQRLEEPGQIAALAGRRVAELGEDTRKLGARRGAERLAHGGVREHAGRAHRGHPRAEGQRSLGLEAVADDRPGVAAHRSGQQRLHQRGLADAGFADHGPHERAGRLLERGRHRRQLRVASHEQRRLGGGRARGRRRLGCQDLAVRGLRLRSGLAGELARERGDAGLVLAERRRPLALRRVEAHERAVRGLVEGLELEQTHGGGRCLGPGVGRRVTRHQRRQRSCRERSQPLPLPGAPRVEGRLPQLEAREEIAGVQAHRGVEPGGVIRVAPEGRHVHVDRVGIERDGLAFGPEDPRGVAPERVTDVGEHVAEAVDGLLGPDAAPAERAQRRAWNGVTRHDRQACQHGEALPAREDHARPVAAQHTRRSEEDDADEGYSTPSRFRAANSSAPTPSQAFSTSALCWPSSGEGCRRGGLPSTRTGHVGILYLPFG